MGTSPVLRQDPPHVRPVLAVVGPAPHAACMMRAMHLSPHLLPTVLALGLVVSCTPGGERDAERAAQLSARFQETLKAELTQAMASGGPAEAIRVCSERAPVIAAQLSTDGQKVRRIGTRVRNLANTPDEVDAAVLAEFAAGTAATVRKTDPDGVVRHYAPLRTAPLCIACHGKVEDLAPPVREQLAKLYPADQATGYALDELRGAVVVESSAR